MKFRMTGLALACLCSASLVFAQQPLKLQITAGRVTLHAQNVPVRTILAEWARVGGAKIVNGERIASPPVTLDLENVSERQALDILLRGVSGYVLAARVAGAPGASMYDRIMILPTSAAPAAPGAPARVAAPVLNGPNFNAQQPAATIRPGIQRAPDPNADDSQDDNNDGVPLARPVPLPRPVNVPPGAPIAPPVIPGAPVVPPADQQPAAPPAVVTTPSNPFGLPAGSSGRPGVVTPAPQAQPQQQPRNAQD